MAVGIQQRETVADLAADHIAQDLQFLQNSQQSSHIQQVASEYLQAETPKNAFLSAITTTQQRFPTLRAPVDFNLSQRRDAVRADLIRKLQVFHRSLGGTDALAQEIEALRYAGSDELAQNTQRIVSGLQRNVIATAHSAIQGMQQQLKGGLWGFSETKERELTQSFQQAEGALQQALTQFDAGETESALQRYSNVIQHHQAQFTTYAEAASLNGNLKFGAGLGVLIGAGAATYFSGGLTLYGLTGSATVTSTTGIGTFTASLLVGGATFTATEKFLNHQIFNVPIFKTHNTIENAVEFAGSSLKVSGMMGFMMGFGTIAEVPTYSGFAAPAVNYSAKFATEFVGMTSYNSIASVSHVIDPNYDGIDKVLSPEGLSQALATLTGLKVGNGVLSLSGKGIASACQAIAGRFPQLVTSLGTAIKLPAYLAMGAFPTTVSGFGRVARGTPAEDIARLRWTGITEAWIADKIGNSAFAGVDAFIQGAKYMMSVSREHLAAATAAGQTVGLELEYLYRHVTGEEALKDPVYEVLAGVYRETGNTVELLRGQPSFVYPDHPNLFRAERGSYTLNGRTISYELLKGSGAVFLTTDPSWELGAAKTVHVREAIDISDAIPNLHEAVAGVFGDGVVAADVRGLESQGRDAFQREYIVYAKAKDNDMLKFQIRIDGGVARFHMMNAEFKDGGRDFEIPAAHFPDALNYLKQVLPGKSYAQKIDTYSGLKITTPEGREHEFKITDEGHPLSEFVSSILKTRDFHLIDTLVDTLQAIGCEGTTDKNTVGIHTHMGVPTRDATGQHTIAPVLGLLREFLGKQSQIQGAIPTHDNRLGYIQAISPEYARLVQDPAYFKTANDPGTILVFAARTAELLSKKYTALNVDNVLALILEDMITHQVEVNGVALTHGAEVTVTHQGQAYQFKVHAAQGGENYKDNYDIVWERPNAEPVSLMRISSASVRKPTVELRIFNTVIDAKTVRLWLEFATAWGWRFGTSQASPSSPQK